MNSINKDSQFLGRRVVPFHIVKRIFVWISRFRSAPFSAWFSTSQNQACHPLLQALWEGLYPLIMKVMKSFKSVTNPAFKAISIFQFKTWSMILMMISAMYKTETSISISSSLELNIGFITQTVLILKLPHLPHQPLLNSLIRPLCLLKIICYSLLTGIIQIIQ